MDNQEIGFWGKTLAACYSLLYWGVVGKIILWEEVTRLAWAWDYWVIVDNVEDLALWFTMAGIVWALTGMWFYAMAVGGFAGGPPGPVMRDMSRGDYEPPWGDATPR